MQQVMPGLFAIVFGVFFIYAGIHRLQKSRRLRRTGVKVKGAVIDVVKRDNKYDPGTMQIRFHTPEGTEHVVDYPGILYGKGQSVELVYNPHKPKEIEIGEPKVAGSIVSYLFIIAGAMAILLGSFTF